jgi:hypothetical protein
MSTANIKRAARDVTKDAGSAANIVRCESDAGGASQPVLKMLDV